MTELTWTDFVWTGGNSASAPDPWYGLKPITSIVCIGDSNMQQAVGFNNMASLNVSGDTGTMNAAFTTVPGMLLEFKGLAQPELKSRVVVTTGGAANTDATIKMLDAPYTGGASAIDQWGMKAQYALPYTLGFPGYAAALCGKFPEILHFAGQGSLKTAELKDRIVTEVLPYSPSHALIYCAVNDTYAGGLSNEEIVQNLIGSCTLCANAGVQVLLFSTAPAASSTDAATARRRIEINAALKDWCATQNDAFYIDIHTPIADPVTGFALPGVLSDAVHLTSYGFKAAVGQLLEIYKAKAVHYIPKGAANRIATSAFSTDIAASSGFSGRMPTGCVLLKSTNATFVAASSVDNGEWAIDITGGVAGEYCVCYLMPMIEAASIQAASSRNTASVEVKIEADAEIAAVLQGNYYLNSGGGAVPYGSTYASWTLMPGDDWYTMAGRDLPVQAGDSYGAGRLFLRVTLPGSGAVRVTLRNPALCCF